MRPLSRPAAREGLLSYEWQDEASAQSQSAEAEDLQDDDPLAAARGAVNGVLWGIILWAAILWVVL